MNPMIQRLKLVALGLFALANVVMAIWQFGWVAPQQKCLARGGWWDGGFNRVCARPVLISDITGRLIADPKARAEALKALGREPGQPARKATPRP
ncbi:MAG TPA: hypothetical protein VHN73_00490 [Phenylobacterium sp.]|nr:hypothetical protein [Phenylobacterium sp.]